MRNCLICGEENSTVIAWHYANTHKPPMSLLSCDHCGFRFLDAKEVDQTWFDNYYATQYHTNGIELDSDLRLNSLADCVASYNIQRVLDIGGTDRNLQGKLAARGVLCDVSGVGEWVTEKYEAIILSHTLEHIYDMDFIFARIKAAMKLGGHLFIEVPVHLQYIDAPLYDYHWQHINKFRPMDLERLVRKHGFIVRSCKELPDYNEYKVYRVIARFEDS